MSFPMLQVLILTSNFQINKYRKNSRLINMEVSNDEITFLSSLYLLHCAFLLILFFILLSDSYFECSINVYS